MIEYVLDFMEAKDQFVSAPAEAEAVEKGIRMYLEENGISPEEKRKYFQRYIDHHLAIIDPDDLKMYFMEYPVISRINQIAIEQSWDGTVSKERVAELYDLMRRLYDVGLCNKYIPAVEVREILGRYS